MPSPRAWAAAGAAAVLIAAGGGALLRARPESTPAVTVSEPRWLRDHTADVRSLDIDDGDYDDLRPLAGWIGQARIVMLGEPSHGDGAAFRARGRLIRYLHERLGFDVLAWESGMFDCARMEAALEDSTVTIERAMSLGLFRIWAES